MVMKQWHLELHLQEQILVTLQESSLYIYMKVIIKKFTSESRSRARMLNHSEKLYYIHINKDMDSKKLYHYQLMRIWMSKLSLKVMDRKKLYKNIVSQTFLISLALINILIILELKYFQSWQVLQLIQQLLLLQKYKLILLNSILVKKKYV